MLWRGSSSRHRRDTREIPFCKLRPSRVRPRIVARSQTGIRSGPCKTAQCIMRWLPTRTVTTFLWTSRIRWINWSGKEETSSSTCGRERLFTWNGGPTWTRTRNRRIMSPNPDSLGPLASFISRRRRTWPLDERFSFARLFSTVRGERGRQLSLHRSSCRRVCL